MNFVSFGDGKVETDQGQEVWFGNTQRGVQTGDEVGHLAKGYELSGVRVVPKKNAQVEKNGNLDFESVDFVLDLNVCQILRSEMKLNLLCPFCVEHLQVLFDDTYLLLLVSLVEVRSGHYLNSIISTAKARLSGKISRKSQSEKFGQKYRTFVRLNETFCYFERTNVLKIKNGRPYFLKSVL